MPWVLGVAIAFGAAVYKDISIMRQLQNEIEERQKQVGTVSDRLSQVEMSYKNRDEHEKDINVLQKQMETGFANVEKMIRQYIESNDKILRLITKTELS